MKTTFLIISFLLSTYSLFSQTFSGGIGLINDVAVNDYQATVTGLVPSTIDTSIFGLESVCIDLTHTWDADLEILIIAPDGTSAILSSGLGGDNDNYTNTCFNYYAATSITSANAPFTGTFRPQGQMGLVNNNQNGNGTWILRITDNAGGDSGDLLSWSLTFGNNPAKYFTMSSSDLPLMVINTNGAAIVDDPKIMADMGIIYNGVGNRNHLTDPWNHYNGKIGIEIRGSSSQMFPKKSYGFECWDVNGNSIDSAILGMPAESDWILSASYSDKSLLNNPLAYHLSNEMGWYAPRCRYIELVLNGEYKGIYILMEKIKRDKNRVDIKKIDPTYISGDSLTGGYIVKIDKTTGSGGTGWVSPFAPAVAPNGQTILFQYEYPNDVNIVPQQAAYIQAYIDSFETALAGPNFADTTIGYAKYINVNSFIDYFLINELSKNVDGYRLSTYLYKNRYSKGGKLVIGPTWDYDIAWGNANYCGGDNTSGWAYEFGNICGGDGYQVPFWWERLLQDSVFQDKIRCRWTELGGTTLNKQYLLDYCDSMAVKLSESQSRNFTVWPILGAYVWPNPNPIPNTYQEEINELKDWISDRWDWLDLNLPGTLQTCNLTSTTDVELPHQSTLVFPNPFQRKINVNIYLRDAQPVKMELLNILGQCVESLKVQHGGGSQILEFVTDETLPNGMYLLNIQAGDKSWTQQVLKF